MNTPTPFDIDAWYRRQCSDHGYRRKYIREIDPDAPAAVREIAQICYTTGRIIYDEWLDEETGETVSMVELLNRRDYNDRDFSDDGNGALDNYAAVPCE